MEQLETLNTIETMAEGLEIVNKVTLESAANKEVRVTGKPTRMYNQSEAMKAANFKRASNITDACKALNINYEQPNATNKGTIWRVSQADIHRLREYNNQVKQYNLNPFTIVISNLKGGVGKTSFSTTLAMALAVSSMNNYKVLLMDLDPQGTATNTTLPELNDEHFTVGDLLNGEFTLSEGETFEELCRESIYDTNHPNLKIMPARNTDVNYETDVEIKKMEAESKGERYEPHKHLIRIHDAVKEDFDFIFIDTPPRFSPQFLGAHYVADSVIIPIKPSENDRDATSKYLDFMVNTYRILMGLGHKGYHSIDLLTSLVKKGSTTQSNQESHIKHTLIDNCFKSSFSEREAVLKCSENHSTIYDVSISQYVSLFNGSRQTLKDACDEFNEIVTEVEERAKSFWGVE